MAVVLQASAAQGLSSFGVMNLVRILSEEFLVLGMGLS
jgi:hypothetical protein